MTVIGALGDLIGHLTILLIVIILILYIMQKDAKRIDLTEDRYDKLINSLIDNITKQQDSYKKEIVSEVRDLSTMTAKVFTGIEEIVSGIKDIKSEVINVKDTAKDVSIDVDRITDSTSAGIKEIVSSLKILIDKLEKTSIKKDNLKI